METLAMEPPPLELRRAECDGPTLARASYGTPLYAPVCSLKIYFSDVKDYIRVVHVVQITSCNVYNVLHTLLLRRKRMGLRVHRLTCRYYPPVSKQRAIIAPFTSAQRPFFHVAPARAARRLKAYYTGLCGGWAQEAKSPS